MPSSEFFLISSNSKVVRDDVIFMTNCQIICRTDRLPLVWPESCPHTWSATDTLFVIELRVPEVPEAP